MALVATSAVVALVAGAARGATTTYDRTGTIQFNGSPTFPIVLSPGPPLGASTPWGTNGLAETSATTQLIAAAFQQAGVAYSTPIVAANAVGVCSLVQQNVGIGLMNPLMLAQEIFPGVITRPFRPRIVLRTCLYYSKVHAPAPPAMRFIDCVERATKGVAARLKTQT